MKVGLWFWVALLLGVPWLMHTGSTATTAANAGVFLGGFFVITSLGELIVIGVARLLGDRPAALVVGFGPRLALWRSETFYAQVNAVPLIGFTVIATSRQRGQLRRVVIARGVAVLVLVMASFGLLSGFAHLAAVRDAMSSRFAPDAYLGVTCVAAALFSLLVLTSAPSQLALWYRLGTAIVANEAVRRGAYADAIGRCRAALALYPDDVSLQITLANALSASASDEALAILEKARAREDLTPDVRAIVDNNFAWQCYLSGRDDLLAEAEQASQRAAGMLPTNPHLVGTRGHVHLWAKRYAEAEPLISKAYALFERDQRSARATAAAGMAMLCAATGRPDEAQTWLARARAEDVTHDLVARAIAAVEPLSRR